MASVASKNLYDLLGNDEEQDPARAPIPTPVNPIDKTAPRVGKRNAGGEPPVAREPVAPARGGGRGGRGGRRGDYSGNERAFHDRDAGSDANRGRSTDEAGYRGRGGRGRGDRGSRSAQKIDRHSQTGKSDAPKQVAHGWGSENANSEWKDEQAGEAIAQADGKVVDDGFGTAPVNAEGENPVTSEENAIPEEPEDKTKSYQEYLAELAEKKLALGGSLSARQANEGASKKLPEGKDLIRQDQEAYFAGGQGKKQRERERKEKNTLLLDHDIQARERESAPRGERGGRGGRGGRGRGDGAFRGEGRGRGGRGRGEGRGEGRGGESRGSGFRGGRGGASPNVADTNAFPSLG